jgi:hypothetical protein
VTEANILPFAPSQQAQLLTRPHLAADPEYRAAASEALLLYRHRAEAALGLRPGQGLGQGLELETGPFGAEFLNLIAG